MIVPALLPFGLLVASGMALVLAGQTYLGLVTILGGCIVACLYLRALGRRG